MPPTVSLNFGEPEGELYQVQLGRPTETAKVLHYKSNSKPIEYRAEDLLPRVIGDTTDPVIDQLCKALMNNIEALLDNYEVPPWKYLPLMCQFRPYIYINGQYWYICHHKILPGDQIMLELIRHSVVLTPKISTIYVKRDDDARRSLSFQSGIDIPFLPHAIKIVDCVKQPRVMLNGERRCLPECFNVSSLDWRILDPLVYINYADGNGCIVHIDNLSPIPPIDLNDTVGHLISALSNRGPGVRGPAIHVTGDDAERHVQAVCDHKNLLLYKYRCHNVNITAHYIAVAFEDPSEHSLEVIQSLLSEGIIVFIITRTEELLPPRFAEIDVQKFSSPPREIWISLPAMFTERNYVLLSVAPLELPHVWIRQVDGSAARFSGLDAFNFLTQGRREELSPENPLFPSKEELLNELKGHLVRIYDQPEPLPSHTWLYSVAAALTLRYVKYGQQVWEVKRAWWSGSRDSFNMEICRDCNNSPSVFLTLQVSRAGAARIKFFRPQSAPVEEANLVTTDPEIPDSPGIDVINKTYLIKEGSEKMLNSGTG
ncbi:hypothetical protein GP486_000176 [Trichoglossum hirsutum]|uniref:Uncharacterized protein n=1 Tax=Trichoglossum hirsutum TaxID=265104 RepID=A0A9P8RTU1_9PEZI|nr:hypothetical protein GP486_000176 [Trichoglossum hirsutum]